MPKCALLALELSQRAPSTIAATKALLQAIRDHRCPPPADDIIAKCYASDEFQRGRGGVPRRSQAAMGL